MSNKIDGGFLIYPRNLHKDEFFKQKEPFNNLSAYWDIVYNSKFKAETFIIDGKSYECKRGQSYYNLSFWAERWYWNKMKVQRFLKELERNGKILYESTNKFCKITVLNYDLYSPIGNQNYEN
jgi:hypothetical protein